MFLKQTRSLKPTWFTITKSITRRWAGGHGGGHYNEPGGYLFGEAPPPPGQRRQKEDWENLWYFGMGGSLLLGAVGLYYRPKAGVKEWAYEEAKARLEAKGEMPTFTPTPKERWS